MYIVLQWVNHTPEGSFPVVCNGQRYAEMVRSQGGETALKQWKALEDKMRPLQQGAALFPAAALRSDPGICSTLTVITPYVMYVEWAAALVAGLPSDESEHTLAVCVCA